jgi:hypothetical protein
MGLGQAKLRPALTAYLRELERTSGSRSTIVYSQMEGREGLFRTRTTQRKQFQGGTLVPGEGRTFGL